MMEDFIAIKERVDELQERFTTMATRIAKLERKNAALRALAQAMVDIPNAYRIYAQAEHAECPFRCGAEVTTRKGYYIPELQHRPDCPKLLAQKLLSDDFVQE